MRIKEIITEKWSEKYKRSINCKNPKGFSQRAHCQGRKKKGVMESVRAYHGNQGGIDTEQLHAPMWFTSDRIDAELYAGDDGYVVVADLNIKNPYIIEPKREETNKVLRRWQELQAQGFDGIYDRDSGDWIPFTRKQIQVISKDDVTHEGQST